SDLRALPDQRQRADASADRGGAERDARTSVVVHVRADPDHDRAGDRDGHRTRALHRARSAGRGGQGLSVGRHRIVAVTAHDVRFPTSRTLAGSDAMHTAPDYSAAYVLLRTDADDG